MKNRVEIEKYVVNIFEMLKNHFRVLSYSQWSTEKHNELFGSFLLSKNNGNDIKINK